MAADDQLRLDANYNDARFLSGFAGSVVGRRRQEAGVSAKEVLGVVQDSLRNSC